MVMQPGTYWWLVLQGGEPYVPFTAVECWGTEERLWKALVILEGVAGQLGLGMDEFRLEREVKRRGLGSVPAPLTAPEVVWFPKGPLWPKWVLYPDSHVRKDLVRKQRRAA